MNDIISIIVPVYNVNDYIDRCLDSLVNQTYKNIEIILIDDGSTDGSSLKCDEWAKKDNRIVVKHKTNGGVSSARNVGIDIAKGKYMLFFDSDDWVDIKACETLMKYISPKSLVVFDAFFIERGKKYKKFNYEWKEKNNINEIKCAFVHGLLGWTNCWNKFFIASIIKQNNIKFDEHLAIGEDYLFAFEYLNYISNVKYCDDPLYNYDLTRESSAMNTKNENLLKKWTSTEMILNKEANNKVVYNSIRNKLFDELYMTACQTIVAKKKDIYKIIVKKANLYLSTLTLKEKIHHKNILFMCSFPRLFSLLYKSFGRLN